MIILGYVLLLCIVAKFSPSESYVFEDPKLPCEPYEKFDESLNICVQRPIPPPPPPPPRAPVDNIGSVGRK